MKNKQLVILAGGKGSRLLGETMHKPKPLVELFNKTTILDILIKSYLNEFNDILILAGYKSELIIKHISKYYSNSHVRVAVENKLAGTAGALLEHSDTLMENFILMNGDTWFDCDLGKLEFYKENSMAQLFLTQSHEISRYGAVKLEDEKYISSFIEKEDVVNHERGLINTGCYLINKKVLDFIKSSPCSLEIDVFPALVKGGFLEGRIADGKFIDIGVPETLEFARNNKEFFKI